MTQSRSTLEITLLTRTSDLVRLLPEWWALWSRSAQATPFQSPAWLLPWWQVFHPGPLMSVAVRRDGLLVGLAPFYLEDGPYGRRLLPLGIGMTDYLDVLIDGAPAPDVAEAFAKAYVAEGGRWDVWSLEELRPDAVACSLAFGTLEGEPQGQSAAPVLALPATVAEWERSRGGRRWRRAWNRVQRHDRVGIAESDGLSGPDLFEALIELHGRRWAAKGEPGVLANPDVRLFHRTAVPHLRASKLLRSFGLQVEGQTVAAYYGFAHRGESYAYLNGFNPDWGFESPGTALIGTAIRCAIGQGQRRFHFLRGQEPYKYLWGAEDRWNVVRTLRRVSTTSGNEICGRQASHQGYS
ncbi:GNAT family N-acetyltransferase [Lichenihabitans sp. Uapishka_5]|uniref:GNAT family N-acetyltransferase n=1 Tax=Lichenihabitans sp. Uapishka_5 TaxID=3037302 RepID=UPI0029E822E9|nr:GNAT family N-acetyltransferase [Lichenihabitans sp. Uapishka_5]MDX7950321.1 GNAT family N-acetyltransferase [Lichenihabitans sp. Uapishka_5]